MESIFWGTRWLDPSFAGDKISGLDQFYAGYDLSRYSLVTKEYDLQIVPIQSGEPGSSFDLKKALPPREGRNKIPRTFYRGHLIDPMPVPKMGTVDINGNSGDFDVAVAEICSQVISGRIKPYGRGVINYFPVYVARRRPKSEMCEHHGYAFWGQWSCTGAVPKEGGQYTFAAAIFYDLDDDAQCDVHDKVTGHSKGLSALANMSARALADVHTDAFFDGWYDTNGDEIDDKCAWVFNAPFVTFTNGSTWKLQSLWSNQAFLSNSGRPNSEGARGCVDGPERW